MRKREMKLKISTLELMKSEIKKALDEASKGEINFIAFWGKIDDIVNKQEVIEKAYWGES